MERLESVKIVIEVETNKGSYRQVCDSLFDLVEWWNAHSDIGLPAVTVERDEP